MSNISVYSDIILERRPLLKTILHQYGDLSIWKATNLLLDKGKANANLFNRKFINVIQSTFPHLESEYLQKLDICLQKNPLVSTADHQCPINHPVYINSNIQLSLFTKSFSLNKKPYIMPPILSFSSLPINNTAYIRGLLMASPKGEKRFTFFGSSMRHDALPTVKPLCFDKKTINYWIEVNRNNFSKQELGFIYSVLNLVSTKTDINQCASYSQQINVWNKWLWRKFFPNYHMEFLPIDLLSKTFFAEELVNNTSLPLYKFLFDLSEEEQLKLFDGIYGCWSLDLLKDFKGGGTCFFWGINKNHRMIPLLRKNKQLVSQDKSFPSINWNPISIAQAWKENKITPSLLMNYLIMAGHFGLFCSGAFNQIGYLQPMMKQYSSGLKKLGLLSESERIDEISTDGIHAFLYFLFGTTKELAIPLCGLNMLQEVEKMNRVEDVLKKITVNDAFKITAPLIFPYIVNNNDLKSCNFSFEKSYGEILPFIPSPFVIQNWKTN